MSIPAIRGVWEKIPAETKASLEASDLCVLSALATIHHAGNDTKLPDELRRRCYPSVATIVEESGQTDRTVQAALRRLEEHGLIEVLGGQGRKVKGGATNAYRLLWDFVFESGATNVKPPATNVGSGATVAPKIGRNRNLNKDSVGLSPDELSKAVSIIWGAAHKVGKGRSSKLKLEAEVKRAHARKHALADVVRGALGYLNSREAAKDNHQFERGTHLVIKGDFFESWIADGPEDLDLAGATPGQSLDLDAWDETRQRRSMEAFSKFGGWNAENGPRPGSPGCPISDEIQREFGETPWADKIAKPAALNLDEEVLD